MSTRPPYWVTLPYGVPTVPRGAPATTDDEFRDDLTWGQFCLFVFIRLQDDLYDGQAQGNALLFGADQFLLEAERTFARHLARSPCFWAFFRECLQRTTQGIVRADRLQRTPNGNRRQLLAAYADVAAVFQVGLAATCLRYRRPRDFRLLQEFGGAVARADQILDDLEDVAEDLARGRFNYVAKAAAACGEPLGDGRPDASPARIMERLWRGPTIPKVLGEARRHFDRAFAVAQELGSEGATSYASSGRSTVERLRGCMHRRTVELLLGPLVAAGGRA